MKLHKRARFFLKCDRCKYSIISEETRKRAERYMEKMWDKAAM